MNTAPARCWAEIDLAALERNLKLIRASLPPGMAYISVIKADAYGHGLKPAAAALQRAGADLFAVANVTEAASLREIVPKRPILLLGPVLPEELPFASEYDLTPTVSTPDEARRFDDAGRAAGRPLSVHLKIDTGMGRLGVWHEEAPALYKIISASPNLRLAGVFTHFASSGDDPVFTAEQRRRFLSALEACRGLDLARLLIHADNSGGLESLPATGPFNAVRIGLLQFGVLPRPGSSLAQIGTEPAFSFRTRVGMVKKLGRGTPVSYGRAHTLRRDSILAVLCVGYGDGMPRAASDRAQVLIRGRRRPVLGRITMDLTLVDVTDLPGVAPGEEVVLFGSQGGDEISAGELAAWAGTIPWDILCAITKRVPRVYRNGPIPEEPTGTA